MRKVFNAVALIFVTAVFCQAAQQKKEQTVTFEVVTRIAAKTSKVVPGAWMAVDKDGTRRPHPYKSEKEIPGVQSKYWIKGDQLRSETKTLTGKPITVISEGWIYDIDESSKTASRRMPVTDKEISIIEKDPTRLLALLKKRGGLKQTGTEQVEGEECQVYQFTSSRDGSTLTVWARKKDGVVIKQKKETPLAVTVTQYQNIKIGAAIPDSTFEVPKAFK